MKGRDSDTQQQVTRPRTPIPAIAASIVISLLGAALPLVLGQIYDRVIPRQAVETLTLLCVALIVAVALEFTLQVARAAVLAWIGARYEYEARTRALSRALYSDLRAFEAEPPGVQLARVSAIDKLRDHYTGEGSLVAMDLPAVLVYGLALYWLSPVLALAPLTAIVIGFVLNRWLGRNLLAAAEHHNTQDERRFSFLIETLRGIEAVKSLGAERLMERRYERLMSGAAASGRDIAEISNLIFGVQGLLVQATTVGIGCLGAWLVIEQQITVGALAGALLLGGRAVQPALRAEAQFGKAGQAALWQKQLDDLASLPPAQGGRAHLASPPEALELRDVSFRAADGRALLDGVSLAVHVGETVAITGPSGSGKSTLMWMLFGALKPDQGVLLVNGEPAENLDLKHMRSKMALLTQTSTLLRGSVVQNLTRFDPDANLDRSMEIARAIGIETFFAEHNAAASDQSAETAQSKLPASVINAIALTRALSTSPTIVLFDEANLMLDGATDARFLDYLKQIQPHVVLIMVTHRPSYLAIAHRRYQLENGRLVAETDAGASEAALDAAMVGRAEGAPTPAAERRGVA